MIVLGKNEFLYVSELQWMILKHLLLFVDCLSMMLLVTQSVYCLRNRFLFPVICGSINHWLEVSRQGDISRARSASDIYTDG